MVHPIFLVEGYAEYFDKFEKFWNNRTYADGKARLRMRKVQLYCPSINESGYEEFLSDFKSFCNVNSFKLKGKSKRFKKSGQGAKNRFKFFAKVARIFFPQLKDIIEDLKKVEDNKLFQKEAKKGNHFILSVQPIGKILDGRYEDGTEIV